MPFVSEVSYLRWNRDMCPCQRWKIRGKGYALTLCSAVTLSCHTSKCLLFHSSLLKFYLLTFFFTLLLGRNSFSDQKVLTEMHLSLQICVGHCSSTTFCFHTYILSSGSQLTSNLVSWCVPAWVLHLSVLTRPPLYLFIFFKFLLFPDQKRNLCLFSEWIGPKNNLSLMWWKWLQTPQ